MSTNERKTRGPRTPSERAEDAGRKAATLLEDVPPCPQREYYLEPIATLLRYYFGSASERRARDAEQAYAGLIGRLREGWRKWGSNAELFARPGMTNEDVLEQLGELMTEVRRRAQNYIDADSSEAADEGFLFIAKAHDIATDDLYWQKAQLRNLAVKRHV